jgi:hypothetical protein
VDDLAKSFLQTQPVPQQELDQVLERSEYLEGDVGTGTAREVPTFLADFLEGIVNRLTVTVSRIEIRIQLEDELAFLFVVDDVDVAGVLTGKSAQRQVSLRNISGSLICSTALFESMSKPLQSSSVSERSTPMKTSALYQSTSTVRDDSTDSSLTASRVTASVADSQLLGSELDSRLLHSNIGQMLESEMESSTASTVRSRRSFIEDSTGSLESDAMSQSIVTTDDDRFADVNSEMGKSRSSIGHDSRFDDYESDEDAFFGSSKKPSDSLEELPRRSRGKKKRPDSSGTDTPKAETSSIRSSFFRPKPTSLQKQDSFPLQTSGFFSEHGSNAASSFPEKESTSSQSSSDSADEDLLESKLFSHEEAESMYMSAMTHKSEELKIPGAWTDSGSIKVPSTRPDSADSVKAPSTARADSPDTTFFSQALSEPDADGSGQQTPQLTTVKKLAHIDSLDIILSKSEGTIVNLGSATVSVDMPIIRILLSCLGKIPSSSSTKSSSPQLSASAKTIRINFVDSVSTSGSFPAGRSEILLTSLLKSVSFSTEPDKLEIGKFTIGYHADPIIFFENASMQTSMQASIVSKRTVMQASLSSLPSPRPDIRISFTETGTRVETLPLHVKVDLQRLDETFSWLGGLSSIFGLSSVSTTKPTESIQIDLRVKIRLDGVLLDLIADHSLQLRSTPVDIAIRGGAATIRVGLISATGPSLVLGDPPILVNLVDLVMQYRPTPEKADLDRLVSMLRDSDDLIMDTLLRQRRQGPRLSVDLSELTCEISRPAELQLLPSMFEDIAKLGTVAKYLPDDERPGLLTLCNIHQVRLYVDVHGIGEVRVRAAGINAAHVGIPLLAAVTVTGLDIDHSEESWLGDVLMTGADIPMIQLRMIGDEPEPLVRLRLWNLRVEYHVHVLMSFLGLKEATTGDAINTMVESVATVKKQKPWRLDVALRDCMIGLNPARLPSKAIVLLTKVNLLSSFGETSKSEVEIQKTSVMVVDNMENVSEPPDVGSLASRLSEMGFVTVSTISSAHVSVALSENVDIELSDDLLVVESCADSTRTLIDLAGGLVPPTPKSTAMKYRTEIMPVEDLLASLTGDAYAPEEEWDADLFGSFHSDVADPVGLDIQEGHFSRAGTTANKWNSVKNTYTRVEQQTPNPLKVRISDVHIIWKLFDGYDWAQTKNTISTAVKEVEAKAERKKVSFDVDDESEIGDFLFNSIYIGVPSGGDAHDRARNINHDVDDLASEASTVPRLRLDRSRKHKMMFELKGVSVDFVVFPPESGETQSALDIRVRDLDILDNVPTSTWTTFATYMRDAGERETGSSMIRLEILNVKPIADLAASEIVLRVTVLPLRLHVDQDALDFITRFFEFKDTDAVASGSADEPFLQRVEVNAVKLKLDYKPKKVDYAGLRSGHTTEFMNFVILDGAEMELRHVIIYGVRGFDRLNNTLNDIWMPDIRTNQLPGVLAGLAPVRSLVNVGSGVRDLVVVPIREYKKDGRIVRSIQKGALAFAKTTSAELAKLGAKLAIGTQTVLQGAEDFLTQKPERGEEEKAISYYADQPIGVAQALRGAFSSLERDLIVARDAIICIPGELGEISSAGVSRLICLSLLY